MRMRHIVVCGLSGPTVFFHILINGTILEKKVTEHKMCIVIFSTLFCPRHLLCQEETREIQSKCVSVFMWSTFYSCSILMSLEFSGQIFEKYSNIKFHKNPSSGSPVVPCGKTAAFRNLSNAPQNLKNWGRAMWGLYFENKWLRT